MIYKYIYKHANKKVKQGFSYEFKLRINGEQIVLKSSVNLDNVIVFRNRYLMENCPNLWEVVKHETNL